MDWTRLLAEVHERCEASLALLDHAVEGRDWADAQSCYEVFLRVMTQHLQAEEHGLFTAFEVAREGGWPLSVVRAEHGEMRALLARLGGAVAARDPHAYGDQAGQLRALVSIHCPKEEYLLRALDSVEPPGEVLALLRDLAQDLARILGSEPVPARPVSGIGSEALRAP